MYNILITGAFGYLGARISKYLSSRGHRITAIDNNSPINSDDFSFLASEVIIGDIRSELIINKLLDIKVDIIIHLISLDHHKSNGRPDIINSINVLPTWNLLNSFYKSGLKKFIYFSTMQVYGNIPFQKIDENFRTLPKNFYGLTHLLSEEICKYYNYNSDVSCINVRLSNSYGSPVFKNNNCWWLVINDLCKTAFNMKKIQLLSDGSPQRDFIHISDVCRAVELLINNDIINIDNNIYHISSGKTYTILELAHLVQKVYKERYGKEIPVILPGNIISYDPNKFSAFKRYIIDNTKLKSLGFSIKTDLISGINELFDYLEKNND